MKCKKIILLIFILKVSLFAQFSGPLSFSSKVKVSCGIIFNKNGSISFLNENPEQIGNFELISNINEEDSNFRKQEKIKVKIENINNSINIRDINKRDIYLVIDRTKKIRISEFETKGVLLSKGKHSIYILIKKDRNSILSGKARIKFDLNVICRGI